MALRPAGILDAPLPGPVARRAAGAFAAVAAGFVVARHGPSIDSVLWLSLASLACALAAMARGKACIALLALAGAAFGAGWFTLRTAEAPRDALIASGAPVCVEGVVVSEPVVAPGDEPRWLDPRPACAFTIRIDGAAAPGEVSRASGRARVAADEVPDPLPRAGDRVRITGRLRPVRAPLNPGEPDARLHAAQEGRIGTLAVPRAALIEPLPPSTDALHATRALLLRLRAGLTERARALLFGGFGEPTRARAVLGAMVLGEQEPALDEVRSAFTRLGLAHVMAISGFNMAAMALVALVLVRATGDRGRVEPLIVAALVALYLLILPAEAPIIRSGVMVLALLGAEALGRRHDRTAVLAWTALGLILLAPMDLWSLGFQLSFGLVGAMLALGPRVRDAMFGPRLVSGLPEAPAWWRWPVEQCKSAVSTTILCWAVALPIVIYHTGLVSPLALASTIVVVPLVTVMLWLAYASLVIGMLIPAASGPAGAALAHLADWVVVLVLWLDEAPGSSFALPRVSLAWTAAALAVVAWWCARGYLRHRALWGASAVVAAWLGLEVWAGPRLPASTPLRIDTLAVGDGTCHIIRGGGEALLWDCGSLRPGVGRWLVPRAARAVGAWRTPIAVVTHPDFDHYSGLLDAAGPLGVRAVLMPRRFLDHAKADPRGASAAFLDGLRGRGIAVRIVGAGDSLRLGAATLEFLSPPSGAPWPADNDHSLIALVRADTPRAPVLLLTGDAQDDSLAALLSERSLRADVMELPHHGSAREAAMRLVAAADPAVVLQSSGPGRVGDARWDPLRPRRAWYATALHGAAWAELRADGAIRSGAFLVPGADTRRVFVGRAE